MKQANNKEDFFWGKKDQENKQIVYDHMAKTGIQNKSLYFKVAAVMMAKGLLMPEFTEKERDLIIEIFRDKFDRRTTTTEEATRIVRILVKLLLDKEIEHLQFRTDLKEGH